MRLIDADKLMGTILEHDYVLRDEWNNTDRGMFTYGIEHAVNEQPTIDLVKHGRWEHEYDTGCVMWACSICGGRVIADAFTSATGTKGRSYCPYCGAKMDGGKE